MAIRSLHFVFKIPQRKEAISFYREFLGMHVLRHEEFSGGCKAYCNGPYDSRWSKTMIGYGPEISHFVLELTYNYGIGQYKHGNDFKGVHIHSVDAFRKLADYPTAKKITTAECIEVLDPAGYTFFVYNIESKSDPIKLVDLSVSNLRRSVEYWEKLCGMHVVESNDAFAVLTYEENQCNLRFSLQSEKIDRGQAFGRIAFACPRENLPQLQKKMEENCETVLTKLVTLDTPGKASVDVVILADPDGHEICFVGDEGFKDLSKVDPKADELLEMSIASDNSDDWFSKRGGKMSQ